jgi:hypothetical protein
MVSKPYAVRMPSDHRKPSNRQLSDAECDLRKADQDAEGEEIYAANKYAEFDRIKLIAISVRSRLFESPMVEVRQSNE